MIPSSDQFWSSRLTSPSLRWNIHDLRFLTGRLRGGGGDFGLHLVSAHGALGGAGEHCAGLAELPQERPHKAEQLARYGRNGLLPALAVRQERPVALVEPG